MSGQRFEVMVGNGTVEGRSVPGGQYYEGKFRHSDLQLATVNLLEQWLKRWEWIETLGRAAAPELRRPRLLVPSTFEVLGTHLWNLVLDNRVGDKLREACDRADDSEPLRVLMSFADTPEVQELARLPWEFLYCSRGLSGYFLATRTNLVLSRYLRVERPETTHPAPTLRVIFWVTLPATDERFEAERAECRRTQTMLAGAYHGQLEIPETISGWNTDEVVRQLKGKADIVHVVGVCRGDRRTVHLYTSDGTWQDAQVLVDVLTGRPDSRPEMVVLHLCDWWDSDTTENFEWLAPKLVSAGIPAVLAMQYPMRPDEANKFITAFYEHLMELNDIGLAVQLAREQIENLAGGKGRRFGAPVLYLHDAEARLLSVDPRIGGVAHGKPTSATITSPAPVTSLVPGGHGRSVRDRLLEVVTLESPDIETEAAFAAWVLDTDWDVDGQVARTIVQAWRREQADDDRLRPLYVGLLQELGRPRHG